MEDMAGLSPRGNLRPVVAALISFFVACAACSRSGPAPERFQKGKPVLSFKYNEATELSISKDDPATGDRWSAQFRRTGTLGPQQSTPRWEITQAPEGMAPSDRLANGGFIGHLLDTLANLRLEAEAPHSGSNPDATLGLKPARYWLRWKAGPPGQEKTHEIRIGAMANSFSAFAAVEGSYLQVEGAALKMLDYLSGFKKLRHTKLSTWTVDDADRIEVGSPGKTTLRAERNSGEWTLPEGKKFSKPVDSYVEAIFQLEIQDFEADRFGAPRYRIHARSRSGDSLLIEVDDQLNARTSDRPGAFFKLHPGAERILSSGFGSNRR